MPVAESGIVRGLDSGAPDPYPSTAGLVLYGTSWHEAAVRLSHNALDRYFAGREDVFIAAEMALYYERAPQGGRARVLIPDLMVVCGVSAHGRKSYKIWEEGGRVPQFVLEVASASTMDRDCGFKRGEYESLGVREYWQLDQTGKLMPVPLRGHRLIRGRYQRVGQWGRGPDGTREYRSLELGLLLRPQLYRGGWTIAFRDQRTGKEIAVGRAMDDLLMAAEGRADSERQARLAAEAQVTELKRRLEENR